MQRLVALSIFLLLAFPHAAFAHATPVESFPASGTNVQEANEVRIRFSERLESGSSRITVKSVSGDSVQRGMAMVEDDPYVLSVPVDASEGVYTVSWSVVSRDDGHFTKGSYAFSLGSEFPPVSSSDTTVVQITTLPEASAMFVEFVGNSMLWGMFLMFAFVLRPLLKRGSIADPKPIKRLYIFFAYIGAAAIVVGGLLQIWLKSFELSGLHEIALGEGLAMYIGTVAGSSTLYRLGAAVFFAILFGVFRRRIFASTRFSFYEGVLFAGLLVFAYFRALVSHASANPFFPELSVAVNVLHLIEKDLWFGVLLVMLATLLMRGREIVNVIVPRTFLLLTTNLIVISFSASYIIWLHLQDFGNISHTTWGETLLALLAVSVLLVGFRTYHILSFKFRPATFSRFFPFSIGAETAASALVVFFSSLIIITSPPLHHDQTRVFSETEQGVSVRLETASKENSQALLTISGTNEMPLLLIGESDGGLQAKLEKRFAGGYVFPLDLLKGKDTKVYVIAKQNGGYDARFTFDLSPDDFTPDGARVRSFDFFTLTMIGIALFSALFAAALLRILFHTPPASLSLRRAPIWGMTSGIVAGLIFGSQFVYAAQAMFGNDFRKQCIADGNMWHLMQPARGGVYTSKTPAEGCMMMSGLYHITDGREYAYLRSLPPAEVELKTMPQQVQAGVPTSISLAFTEEDGSPAKMSVIHDKLVHLVIISADMTEFAHVHPEDIVTAGDNIAESRFEITHTFPKAGEYLLAVDYLHGLTPESRQFRIQVGGAPIQESQARQYSSPQHTQGLDVSLRYSQPFAGEMNTLWYTIRDDDSPVTDLMPYLSAAMHLAIVKNDLFEFIHTHGEVHAPGYVPPKTSAISHNHAPPPPRFGPNIEAHVIFPSPGLYTVFGEFARQGAVVPTKFTVRVE